MADFNDLISKARQSKLGKAIGNVVSRLDRDKEQAGFQFTSPQFRQNVNNAQTSLRYGLSGQSQGRKGFGGYNVFNQVKPTIFDPIYNYRPVQGRPSIGEAITLTSQNVVSDFGKTLSGKNTFLGETPVVKNLLEMSSRTGQTIGSGYKDIGEGVYNVFDTSKSTLNRGISGGSKIIKGIGKVAAPTTLPFQGFNLGSEVGIDQTKRFSSGVLKGMTGQQYLQGLPESKKSLNLPFIGNIDPYEAVGSMVGFTQNPINKKLFNLTEKLLPANGNALKWFTTTASRGSLEDLVLNADEIINSEDKQKAIIDNMTNGAISELVGQGILIPVGKGFEIAKDTKVGKVFEQTLENVLEGLSDLRRRLEIPVKTLDQNNKTGEFITRPMWKEMIKKKLDGLVDFNKPGQSGAASIETLVDPTGIGRKLFEPEVKKSNIFEERVKAIQESGLNTKTDEQLLKEYNDELISWGKQQFGKDFDPKLWGIDEQMVRASGGIENLARTFDAYKQELLNTKGGGLEMGRRLRNITEANKPQTKLESKIETKKIKSDRVIPRETIIHDNQFKELPDRKTQIKYITNSRKQLKGLIDAISKKVKSKGVSFEDYVKDIEEGGIKYPELNALHKKLMDKFASATKETDPSFEPRSNYYPHKFDDNLLDDNSLKIDEGLWISQADLDLGNFKQRQNAMDTYSTNYPEVMKSYIDQFLTKKYINNLKTENKFQEEILSYSRIIGDNLRKGEKISNIEVPDFLGKAYEIKSPQHSSKFNIGPIGWLLRTNDNIFKNIGGPLEKSWSRLRDIDTKLTGNWKKDSVIRDKALQEFVEVAGNTRLTNKTKAYVNDFIAKRVSAKQMERSLMEKIADEVVNVFATAHLGGSIKTAAMQLLELTKLPVIFKPDEIALGFKNIDAKRLNDTYKVSEISSPYDLNRINRELNADKTLAKQGKEAISRARDLLFLPMQKAEETKNILYASIAEQQGKKMGLKGDDLVKHVRDILYRYANISGKNNRAELYDNAFGRLFFQYGQYNLKNTQQIYDLFTQGEKGKATALFGANLSGIILGAAIVGTPAKYLLDQVIPLGFGPIFSFTQNIIDTLNSNYSEESKNKRLRKLAITNLVPAGTQGMRTYEGLTSVNRGYTESSGGRMGIPVDQTPMNYLRGSIFGKNSLPGIGKFQREGSKYFGETQTATYKSILDTNGPEEAKKYYDNEMSLRKANSGDISDIEGIDTSKLQTKQSRAIFKKKLEFGAPVTSDELISYYLDKSMSLPNKTKYEKNIKRSELMSDLSTIENSEDLSDEQKSILRAEISKNVGISMQDLDTYDIAKQKVDIKMGHVLDQYNSLSQDQFLRYLINGRRPINGKILISDGVLDNLAEDGLISYDLAKDLKKVDLKEDGTLKVKKSSGSIAKKVSYPKFNYSALKSLKPFGSGGTTSISVPKIDTSKLTFSGI